jgi:hypothetical protein
MWWAVIPRKQQKNQKSYQIRDTPPGLRKQILLIFAAFEQKMLTTPEFKLKSFFKLLFAVFLQFWKYNGGDFGRKAAAQTEYDITTG